jgi:hypothetical protein
MYLSGRFNAKRWNDRKVALKFNDTVTNHAHSLNDVTRERALMRPLTTFSTSLNAHVHLMAEPRAKPGEKELR